MKYMGSKSRIAKYIVPIIQKFIDDNNIHTYIEPFVGGANIIDKINCEIKKAGDKQYYLIELFKNLHRINELPKDFVEREHYSDVRASYNNKDGRYEDWYIGAIGFLASYNGRFFDGGYAGLSNEKGKIRNYYSECKRNLEEQIQRLNDIAFCCCEYYNWDCTGCLIYCDPPYQGTKQYNVSKDFNYNQFWDWVRKMSEHNIVLVSEENAPNDFITIWERPIKRTIKVDNKQEKIEKLFIYKGKGVV